MSGPDELEERITVTAASIREWCQRNDYAVTVDDCICERAAASVLGYRSPDSLRKQVREGRNRLEYRMRGNVRHYRVLDLSLVIETGWAGNCGEAGETR
ncbi:hypothetical protein [Paraburkholderia sp. BR14320]|uniref:hypothetical protein n=1 Tax=unclassified Paraburkholderia TaxID=2615204 RepID=UPI0034CF3FC3